MFILVMSFALQGAYDRFDSTNPVELLVVNNDTGDLAKEAIVLIRELPEIKVIENGAYTSEKAEELIVNDTVNIALIFPEDFSLRVQEAATDPMAQKATVRFIIDPAGGVQLLGSVEAVAQGAIERIAARSQAPLQIQYGFTSIEESAPIARQTAIKEVGASFIEGVQKQGGLDGIGSSGVEFKETVPSAFRITKLPNSVEQNVPGFAIFGVFFIMQTIGLSFLKERQLGTYNRLLVAPLQRAVFMIGKLVPYYTINLVQIVLMFGVGVVIFHMGLGNDLGALIAVSLATALAATTLGLLIARIGKTEEQINGLGILISVTLAAVGGMMVPTFMMPRIMQKIAFVTPHAWALSGYHDVIVRGLGIDAVWPEVLVLVSFAALFLILAIVPLRFNRQENAHR
jgi:ABC-2 type transport system permease protein